MVRVICQDIETRRGILKGANKLRTVEGYERTYISPDLTKSQQEVDKRLRDKLRELRVQHKEAKINNGEIIIFESGTRIVLFARMQD